MKKFTSEQAMENEKTCLIDALLDGSIKLNDNFLETYCSEEVKKTLEKIPENERSFYLDYGINEENCFFNGTVPSKSDGIILNISEIEVQFEGKAEDYFEDIDEWTIDGNLAYYYVGYGLSVNVDCKAIEIEWKESNA